VTSQPAVARQPSLVSLRSSASQLVVASQWPRSLQPSSPLPATSEARQSKGPQKPLPSHLFEPKRPAPLLLLPPSRPLPRSLPLRRKWHPLRVTLVEKLLCLEILRDQPPRSLHALSPPHLSGRSLKRRTNRNPLGVVRLLLRRVKQDLLHRRRP
jgi:hypothetical protein